MGKLKDLTGQRFGRLTALRATDRRVGSAVVWECQCDCGNIAYVARYHLLSGNTKSCGCQKSESSRKKAKDLTGQRFGSLVAVRPTDKRQNTFVVWECKCDCGNTTYVTSAALIHGNTKSCGCSFGGDLSGQRVGRLVIIQPTEKRMRGHIAWECKCDCGNTVYLPTDVLRSGHTRSCGCLLKDNSQKIKDLVGQRFGRLVVIKNMGETANGKAVWECLCDCGNITKVRSTSLLSGGTRSCGCLRNEAYKENNEKLTESLALVDGTSISHISNKSARITNTTGCTGVSFIRGKYRAYIGFKGKRYELGGYELFEDAVRVRKKAEALLHDETAEYYERWKAKSDADPKWGMDNPIRIEVKRNGIADFEVSFDPYI